MPKNIAYVITHEEGEYDSVVKIVDEVVVGPRGMMVESLRVEYSAFLSSERVRQKEAWKGLPKSGRAPMRYARDKSFVDWLVENKGLKRLEYEEVDPTVPMYLSYPNGQWPS